MTTKSIQEIDDMRDERDINYTTLSLCVGGTENCWGNAIRQEMASERLKANAIKVFKYYDIYGIVPEPDELEMEPLGRHVKS